MEFFKFSAEIRNMIYEYLQPQITFVYNSIEHIHDHQKYIPNYRHVKKQRSCFMYLDASPEFVKWKVVLKEYEASAEGMIKSYYERDV